MRALSPSAWIVSNDSTVEHEPPGSSVQRQLPTPQLSVRAERSMLAGGPPLMARTWICDDSNCARPPGLPGAGPIGYAMGAPVLPSTSASGPPLSPKPYTIGPSVPLTRSPSVNDPGRTIPSERSESPAGPKNTASGRPERTATAACVIPHIAS